MRARPCPRNIIQPTNIFAQPNLSEVRGGRARAKPGKINQHPFLKVAGSCPLGLAACCCLLIIAGSQLPGAVCEGRKVVGTEGAILEKGTATTMEDLRAGKLAGAKKLDLSWAKLDEVPKEVFDLADSLEVLNLQGNSISSLPDDMAKLKRLKILFLSNNKFAALPKTLGGCPSLSMLALRSCGLEEIPPESLAPNLRWLILTDNNIKELPAKIGDCDKMQKLMLSGNRIESLPSEMAGCKNLELVRLASNRLTRQDIHQHSINFVGLFQRLYICRPFLPPCCGGANVALFFPSRLAPFFAESENRHAFSLRQQTLGLPRDHLSWALTMESSSRQGSVLVAIAPQAHLGGPRWEPADDQTVG
jgi:hypothetical protein